MHNPQRGLSVFMAASVAVSALVFGSASLAQAAPNPGPPGDPGGPSTGGSKTTKCSHKLVWTLVASGTKSNLRVRQYVAAKGGRAVTCNVSTEVKANSKTSLKVKAFYSWKETKTVNGKTKVEVYTSIPPGQCVAVDSTLVRKGTDVKLIGPDICSS